MPIPIKWQCCVEGCEEVFDDLIETRYHELRHFRPRYKVGETVNGHTILNIRVRRVGIKRQAALCYDVEFKSWFGDGEMLKATYGERTLLEGV